VNTRELDPTLNVRYLIDPEPRRIARVLSNSFGFGGTNCALVLGRAP
jgi:3-oxoacyl-[acyl-carrier-protein] synthase-1